MLGRYLCQKPIWFLTLRLPLVITSLLIVIAYGSHQGNRTQVSPRLSVEIFEEGSGEVTYSFDDWGGIAFSFNGVPSHNEEGIIPFSSHPEGKGVFEVTGGAIEFGPEEMNPCGWVNLSAWMKTTFRFIFTPLTLRLFLKKFLFHHLSVSLNLVRHGQMLQMFISLILKSSSLL